uniref:Transposase n=1 Tax=Meloidogyne javanica TaxID=6303 RepID=A0A915LFE9_MELJA
MPQQQTLKSICGISSTTSQISDELDVITDQDIDLMDLDETEKTKISEPDIAIALRAKSPWDNDGDKRNMINKFLMEMICVDLQPLSIVENIGFRRFVNELQPRYKIPSRSQVTRTLLPQMFTSLKEKIKKVVVLSAKPIKGRHNASVLKELLNVVLSDFSIPKSKIFVVLRDAAEVMVKVCYDLGLKSIDCFAHKCNLAIWDGIRKLNDDESIKNLIERVKKFVRKLKKSRIQ